MVVAAVAVVVVAVVVVAVCVACHSLVAVIVGVGGLLRHPLHVVAV